MAHEITIRENGYAEMAFVGKTPWHGLGQELNQNSSLEEWRKAAGMDWEIKQTPAMYQPEGFAEPQKIDSRYVQYRSDNGKPLSVVSERYKPVQPSEVLEFFRDLVEESGFRLHTAGTLFDGRRLWALAETGKFGEVVDGDGIGGFLLLSTSCDKTLATTARFTSVRVVCNNTLGMATKQASNVVSFTHLRHFDHQLMKQKLGATVETFGAFMEMSKYLQKQRIQQDQAKEFVAKILKMPEVQGVELKETRPFKRIMELFNGTAKGSELVGNTKWGLLNAVTEYFDHHQPSRTQDAKLNSTWFGSGDMYKTKAVEVLTA